MPRTVTNQVSRQTLKSIYRKFDIWRKIKTGELTSEPTKPEPSNNWPEGTAAIIKHLDAHGKHVATTHRVENTTTGKIYHWDAKDIRIGGICYWRGE